MVDQSNRSPLSPENVVSFAEWRAKHASGLSRRQTAQSDLPTDAPDHASSPAPCAPAVEERPVDPAEEAQRVSVSRALDRLAVRMPVAYDAIRHVAERWIRRELSADPAWEEGAMRLAHWLKAKVEFHAFLRAHPGITPDTSTEQLEGFDAKALGTIQENRARYADVPPAPRMELVPSPHARTRRALRSLLGERVVPVRSDEWMPQGGGQSPEEDASLGDAHESAVDTSSLSRSVRTPLDPRRNDDLYGRDIFGDAMLREYRAHLDAIYTAHLSVDDGHRLEAEVPAKRALLAPELLVLPALEVQLYAVRALGECYAQVKRVLDEADAHAGAGETPGVVPLAPKPE